MISSRNTELTILFGAICDGLRQEVRYRQLAQLIAPKEVMSLTEEREAQLVCSLAYYIRNIGFTVQVDSYFYDEPSSRRPDLAMFLPASREYLFLEVKIINPNSGFSGAIEDIEKLNSVVSARDKRNGLIAIGFRNPTGRKETFDNKYSKLSNSIQNKYPYREIGIKKIDLESMDNQAIYAMAGFWVHKQGQ
jgi:hypothetical protein